MNASAKRLNRLILVYRVVQIFLLGLFLFMAWHFQNLFQGKGMPQIFFNSILTALVIQLLLFYPIRKFAIWDAQREAAPVADPASAEGKKQRQQRLYSDMLKVSLFLFFATFIYLAPPATFFMSTAFFAFILALLTYAQCFNFVLSRLLRNSR